MMRATKKRVGAHRLENMEDCAVLTLFLKERGIFEDCGWVWDPYSFSQISTSHMCQIKLGDRINRREELRKEAIYIWDRTKPIQCKSLMLSVAMHTKYVKLLFSSSEGISKWIKELCWRTVCQWQSEFKIQEKITRLFIFHAHSIFSISKDMHNVFKHYVCNTDCVVRKICSRVAGGPKNKVIVYWGSWKNSHI